MTDFPTSLDSFSPPSPGQTLASPRPAYEYVRELQEAVEALEAAVGVVDSLVADSLEYRMDNHGHPSADIELEHDMLDANAHTDAVGGSPNDGAVVMWVVDEDTGSEGYTAQELPSGVSDHGTLAGLADEDHPQYALAGHSHLAEDIVDNSIVIGIALNSVGTGNDRGIFIAPWACRVKTFAGVMHGGTTPSLTVQAQKNGTTAIFATDLVLTDTLDPVTVSDPDATDGILAAGDWVEVDPTVASGTPNAFFQLEVERI